MKQRENYWIPFWLLVVALVGLASNVQAQNLFQEMDQLKSEVTDLKRQLEDLRNLVLELRRVVLKSLEEPPSPIMRQSKAKEKTVAEEAPPPDEKELTRIICQAVGKFFEEADVALQAKDRFVAKSQMDKALHKLYSSVGRYSGTHRVSKLLEIYEGLAWNTYTAVQLRQSLSGNEDFIKVLNKHRRKYLDTCPKQ